MYGLTPTLTPTPLMFDDYNDEDVNTFLKVFEERLIELDEFNITEDHVTDMDWDDRVIIGVDVPNYLNSHVVSLLRIDIFPDKIECGHDETMQYSSIDTDTLVQKLKSDFRSVKDLANWAFDWLCSEITALDHHRVLDPNS